ncbi:hypothetical protein NHH03_24275 [Stieleria sp. TO1_6]|uniref:hypothetical protein n=1 Tax=Stieleria tagensis TaxID=2956795 RepID=UPI00209B043A|nr:hypothetical protein [Stieleria tagensis]MCO8124876.1 hypothetical protein [Stieleria tagensis]
MFRRLSNQTALAAAIVVGCSFSVVNAEQIEADGKKAIVTTVYNVSDLTSFTDGQHGWDYTTLLELLKTKIGDDQTSTIAPYPQNLSLIISTTNEKHALVAKTLKQERAKAKQTKANSKHAIVTRVYKVGDMAAFTQDKSLWDPSILLELLRTKIGEDESTSFAPYPQNLSLIISTTSEKHDIVVDTIEKLRQKK